MRLPKDIEQEFGQMAESHADYLAEKIFKVAYISAFIHGAKHMFDHLRPEREAKDEARVVAAFTAKVPVAPKSEMADPLRKTRGESVEIMLDDAHEVINVLQAKIEQQTEEIDELQTKVEDLSFE